MALTRQGRDLTEAHKQAQIELSLQAVIDQRQLVGALLDPWRLDATRLDWLGAAVTVAEQHYYASASLSEAYLQAYRQVEGEPGPIERGTFDALGTAGAFDGLVGYVKHLTRHDAPPQALQRAVDGRMGMIQRATLAGGRELVTASARAHRNSLGWRRVTDGNPCAFCAMLAGRGPVYTSAENAGKVTGESLGGKDYRKLQRLKDAEAMSVAQGHGSYGINWRDEILKGSRARTIAQGGRKGRSTKRDIGEKYHDFCGCTVEEVFEQWNPTADEKRFADLYASADGKDLKETLSLMRANGQGIINDAAAPATQTGGGSSDGPPPAPRAAAGNDDPDDRWRRAANGSRADIPGTVTVPPGLNIGAHEEATGHRLAQHGADVRFRPVDNTPGAKNPDADVDGQVWEFKAPAGSSVKNTISEQFKRAGKQAQNVVIDLSRCGIPDEIAVAQCARRFAGQKRIKRLIVLDKAGAVAFYGSIT